MSAPQLAVTDGEVDYQLRGKTAYVSAGAHGIGEAIADLSTQEGVQVIVADHDEASAARQGRKWRGTIAANLATAEGVERAVASARSARLPTS